MPQHTTTVTGGQPPTSPGVDHAKRRRHTARQRQLGHPHHRTPTFPLPWGHPPGGRSHATPGAAPVEDRVDGRPPRRRCRSTTRTAISITVGTDSAEASRRLQESGPAPGDQRRRPADRLPAAAVALPAGGGRIRGAGPVPGLADPRHRTVVHPGSRTRPGRGPRGRRALERALRRRDDRPAGTTLAINLSPGVLASPAVAAVLPDDLSGIEIELTEHEWAPGTGRLRRQLDLLRERGARIAIDDVGVAHSGLRRVMELAPDRIKLDRHLVQGVSTSTVKAALIRAVVDFAEHIGASVCAEGCGERRRPRGAGRSGRRLRPGLGDRPAGTGLPGRRPDRRRGRSRLAERDAAGPPSPGSDHGRSGADPARTTTRPPTSRNCWCS